MLKQCKQWQYQALGGHMRAKSKNRRKMVAGAGVGAAAGKIGNIIVNLAALALCIEQTFMDSTYNEAGELVFDNFSVVGKSVSCFKLFITAYHATHTEGSEMFAFVCLLGLFLHWYAITTHLDRNHKAWARTRIVGMATMMAAEVFLLCRGMVIPKDHAWHTIAVPVIFIFLVFLEAALLIHTQMKDDGDNQNLLRDLLIALADTLINIYRFGFVGNTHNPWVAEKILNSVGSCLPVLIGASHVGWIAFKMGIYGVVVEWFRKIPRVFAGKKEHATGAAMHAESDGDGGAQEQAREEGVEVVVAVPA